MEDDIYVDRVFIWGRSLERHLERDCLLPTPPKRRALPFKAPVVGVMGKQQYFSTINDMINKNKFAGLKICHPGTIEHQESATTSMRKISPGNTYFLVKFILIKC